MSLILDGTNGVSDIDGSAATPAIRGTDTNTGIFFPAADTIAFAEGGTESMRVDANGNVLVGTTSALYNSSGRGLIELNGSTNSLFALKRNNANDFYIHNNSGSVDLYNNANTPMVFATNGSERMRIDSSGNLLVGTTSADARFTIERTGVGGNVITAKQNLAGGWCYKSNAYLNGSLYYHIEFLDQGVSHGAITSNGSTTSYATTSDYRLKENIAPMTGALATVAQLKPCTYIWKATGTNSQGFIAHELAEVVPDCVVGKKDAVETVDELDADGKKIGTKEVPKYQGIDTSFLVATLTAAIQELKATVDAQAARIAALEAAV